jgi:hypothetical protein
MSNLLKHMAIITDGRYHADAEQVSRLEAFIADNEYQSDDIMGAIFLCWFQELDELFSIRYGYFPKDQIITTAKALTGISDAVIKSGNLNNVELTYSDMIKVYLQDKVYRKEVFDILTEKTDHFSLIIKNASGRIIDSKYNPCHNKVVADKPKWVVQTKVSNDRCSVEVSAVLEKTHGVKSWGWHDGNLKVIVLDVQRLYQQIPVDQSIIDAAEAVAYNICVEKNSAN